MSTMVALPVVAGCEEPTNEFFEDTFQKITLEDGMDFFYYASAPIDEPRDVGRYKNLFVFEHGGGLDDIQHFNAATNVLTQPDDQLRRGHRVPHQSTRVTRFGFARAGEAFRAA